MNHEGQGTTGKVGDGGGEGVEGALVVHEGMLKYDTVIVMACSKGVRPTYNKIDTIHEKALMCFSKQPSPCDRGSEAANLKKTTTKNENVIPLQQQIMTISSTHARWMTETRSTRLRYFSKKRLQAIETVVKGVEDSTVFAVRGK